MFFGTPWDLWTPCCGRLFRLISKHSCHSIAGQHVHAEVFAAVFQALDEHSASTVMFFFRRAKYSISIFCFYFYEVTKGKAPLLKEKPFEWEPPQGSIKGRMFGKHSWSRFHHRSLHYSFQIANICRKNPKNLATTILVSCPICENRNGAPILNNSYGFGL